jgi:periplasmic copper chaperone A
MKSILTATALLVCGTSAAFAQNAHIGDIEITHAWAPEMAKNKLTNSAAYIRLADIGTKPDELISASSPVAQKVELHVFGVENGIYRMLPSMLSR